MKKLRITPLNCLSVIGLLFGIFLFTKINSNNLFAVGFAQAAFAFTIVLLVINIILRFIFKDFAKVVIAETVLLTISIIGIIGYFIFVR